MKPGMKKNYTYSGEQNTGIFKAELPLVYLFISSFGPMFILSYPPL